MYANCFVTMISFGKSDFIFSVFESVDPAIHFYVKKSKSVVPSYAFLSAHNLWEYFDESLIF